MAVQAAAAVPPVAVAVVMEELVMPVAATEVVAVATMPLVLSAWNAAPVPVAGKIAAMAVPTMVLVRAAPAAAAAVVAAAETQWA